MGDRLEQTERCFFLLLMPLNCFGDAEQCDSLSGVDNIVEVCAGLQTVGIELCSREKSTINQSIILTSSSIPFKSCFSS